MSGLDLDALEKVARAAPDDKLLRQDCTVYTLMHVRDGKGGLYLSNRLTLRVEHLPHGHECEALALAAHIEAFSPPTVQALIERTRWAESQLAACNAERAKLEAQAAEIAKMLGNPGISAHVAATIARDMIAGARARSAKLEAALRRVRQHFLDTIGADELAASVLGQEINAALGDSIGDPK